MRIVAYIRTVKLSLHKYQRDRWSKTQRLIACGLPPKTPRKTKTWHYHLWADAANTVEIRVTSRQYRCSALERRSSAVKREENRHIGSALDNQGVKRIKTRVRQEERQRGMQKRKRVPQKGPWSGRIVSQLSISRQSRSCSGVPDSLDLEWACVTV